MARRPNLLLLDEPTNHLDLSMRHTLLLALQEFPGAVVVVSHDRALLRGTCDRFVLVANGALQPFEGDLEDYAAWLSATARAAPAGEAAAAGPSRREERRRQAEARQRLSPLRTEQQQLEASLATLARERVDIETLLADAATYRTRAPPEQRELARRHAQLSQEIHALEERWLLVMSALEERAS